MPKINQISSIENEPQLDNISPRKIDHNSEKFHEDSVESDSDVLPPLPNPHFPMLVDERDSCNSDEDDTNSAYVEVADGFPTIRFCHKCGSELVPDSIFCSRCGAKIPHNPS